MVEPFDRFEGVNGDETVADFPGVAAYLNRVRDLPFVRSVKAGVQDGAIWIFTEIEGTCARMDQLEPIFDAELAARTLFGQATPLVFRIVDDAGGREPADGPRVLVAVR